METYTENPKKVTAMYFDGSWEGLKNIMKQFRYETVAVKIVMPVEHDKYSFSVKEDGLKDVKAGRWIVRNRNGYFTMSIADFKSAYGGIPPNCADYLR